MTRQYWANLALCILLGSLAIFSITQIGSALAPKGLFVSDHKPSHGTEGSNENVVLTRYQVGENGKNIVEADFHIENKLEKNIKNVRILCEFYDNKGRYRDRQKWILPETIPAMDDMRISSVSKRYVNTGARALSCSIIDYQLVKKPIVALERHVGEGHGEASGATHGDKPSAGH